MSLGSPDGLWPLELSLTPEGEGSSLLFVHHLAEPYDARSTGSGWHYYLDRLSAVVTGAEVPEDFTAYEPAPPGAYAVPPAP